MIWPYFQGIGIGGGLIIAIGAQNAFVLAQGIRRNHPVQTAAVCSLCDAILIFAGVSGVGALLATNSLLQQGATWLGTLFLFWYGIRSLRSALSGGDLVPMETGRMTRSKLLATTLALTLLNPHVYIDTIILLGSLAGRLQPQERYLFAAGAITSSFLWFFGLSLGAGFLAPLFRRPIAWRCLDSLVCLTMWSIALSLIWSD